MAPLARGSGSRDALPVVVIGAGPAGLAAAYSIARRGRRPLVLEAADAVGGLAGSVDLSGFKVDYGPHRLHLAAAPEVLELYREAMGGALSVRARSGLLHLGGARVPYPLSPLGMLRGLGAAELGLHAASALWARLSRPRGTHFGAEAARRLGRRAAKRLYEPAARKVWGLPPEALDAALGRARVRRGGLSRRGAAGGRQFLYPGTGIGVLAEGLAARVRALGGEVRLRCAVEGLTLRDRRIAGVRVSGETIETDSVVATAPLPSLCAWAGCPSLGAGLDFRSLTLLYLVLGVPRASAHDVHYFADEEVPASRLFEAKGFTDGAGPEDRTAIGFDLPCFEGDATWRADGAELLDRVRPALERVGLARAPILWLEVRRVRRAYPLYRWGFTELRQRALEALAQIEGLYPAGRNGLFVHDNVHHACAAGLAAGRAAASRLGARSWRELQRPFLHARVED